MLLSYFKSDMYWSCYEISPILQRISYLNGDFMSLVCWASVGESAGDNDPSGNTYHGSCLRLELRYKEIEHQPIRTLKELRVYAFELVTICSTVVIVTAVFAATSASLHPTARDSLARHSNQQIPK